MYVYMRTYVYIYMHVCVYSILIQYNKNVTSAFTNKLKSIQTKKTHISEDTHKCNKCKIQNHKSRYFYGTSTVLHNKNSVNSEHGVFGNKILLTPNMESVR